MSENLTTLNFIIPVQEYITQVEARMREQAVGQHPDLQEALDHLLNSGGKRVRPSVSLLVGEMIGADLERTVTLAAAVEMLHTATLVHDDMIDGALLRRGIPTLNAEWTPAATILTGDFIFARAAKLAAETGSIEIMNLFAKTLSTVVNGEITQIFRSRGLASREDYFERIYAKTASMFELAAIAPGYLSDIDEPMFDSLKRYGYEVGMAFQIVDDILDFISDQAEIGKPVGSDLGQGLITLPALCYLESMADNKSAQELFNAAAEDDLALIELESAIRNSDAVDQAMGEAKEFIDRALLALEVLPSGAERLGLENLANYVADRRL